MSLVVVERPPYVWSSEDGWPHRQLPRAPGATGALQPGRIQDDVADPAGGQTPVMRVELRPYRLDGETPPMGDVNTVGNTNRAESYWGFAANSNVPASGWECRPGRTLRFQLAYYLDPSWTFGTDWEVLTQWKGLTGGSPPVAVELDGTHLRVRIPGHNFDLGGMPRGQWVSLDVTIKFSTGADGFVEVKRNGVLKASQTGRTMDTYVDDGVTKPVPIYLKVGLYRGTAWLATHIAFFRRVLVESVL